MGGIILGRGAGAAYAESSPRPVARPAVVNPVEGPIGGAGALIVGRYVSKDVAKDIASKTVVAGATGCLSSLA
ncbi:hypothetical protein ACFTZK_05025 [Streptomyces decoyicus]|uniref:hypothetical protein n=1 Tax=Streptomyces decoyicus TaxID=249567 RepID=UPI0036437109